MGLSELEDLQERYSRLEHLYSEAVKERDEAIEERNKATVLIALQLQTETQELNEKINSLQNENKKLIEENEDLKIRLGYAKDDLNKLQQKHIKLQIEQEQCLQEKEDALALLKELETPKETLKRESNQEVKKQDEEKMANQLMDPAYNNVRDEIFASASEKDLELEPRPPVTMTSSRLEDAFEIHEEVGRGKFGVVKRVTERSSKKMYAAKYIRLGSSGSGSSREDIMREIHIMNELHHKRLVGLVDAFDMSRQIVMIMEFVSGGELFQRVADADCLTEKEASFYMYQLLQGLQYMHSKNIVHLDLKPENIVCVSKDSWDIKVIDFGLAQELVPGVRMTALKGTPEFMAPEAVNFEPISLATDMWSVGVIAYILLSGLSPLLGDDDNETLANVTAVEWDFDDESFDVITDEAKEFISKLLVKNSKKRNTVKESLEHEWMKKSASANAVKIDTKKLKQFLVKRRWQKSVNALVAVRRLSSISSLMNMKTRPSVIPALATVPSCEEEGESEDNKTEDNDPKEQEKVDKQAEEVNKIPVFLKGVSDRSAMEGETVSLEVLIDSDSDCQLQWFKNSNKLSEGGRISFVNDGHGKFSLILRDAEDEDSGEYWCVAQNEAGKVSSAGKLSVETSSKSEDTGDEEEVDSSIEVPVFTKELQDVTVSERDTVTLEVVVSGSSPYELEWFKNAVDITESERISLTKHEGGRFTLVIRECEDDDTGEYCCVAQNEAGRVTCAGWLTIEVSEEDDESEESEDEDVFVPKDFVDVRQDDVQKFYCIEEEVGRGRFGIVKKCVELNTATRFCAKFIKSRPSQKEEFKREVDVMNVLHHPRLIRLYDAFEESRQIVLIMEYARGGDLNGRIDGDSLPEFEAVKILKQVLEGLKFMHDKGYMHLDLKPQNVMFKNEGGSKVKLIDFSLTRKFDPQQETKISFGTAEYVAPEIVNYEPVTLSADMWAIGIIAYIMLSGESPFLGESEADTFNRITKARWEFSDVFDYVSKEAKDFIKRLLLKEPKKRMTVNECLEHEWIKSPGFTGKQKSKHFSEGELGLDENFNIASPTERKRLESSKSEEEGMPPDAKKMEAKLKELVSKLQNSEKESQELEDKLRDEEERADALEDELHTSETSRKELEEKISKLETENVSLSKKAKTNSDVLKRAAESEGERRALEDQLFEKTKALETLSEKYNSLKERIDNYDVLEEKVYLLERERKEFRDTKQNLEDEVGSLRKVSEDLQQTNENNALVHKALEDEIVTLREEKDKYELKLITLRDEKESLVEELTKRFGVLDDQKKTLSKEKNELEAKLTSVEKHNSELKVTLEKVASEMEGLKERAREGEEEKDTDEMEKELSKLRKQKEESQKTCEDLASKLSKAYAELEQSNTVGYGDEIPDNEENELSALQRKVTLLEKDRDQLEDDLEDKETEINELRKTIEQLKTDSQEKETGLQNYKSKLDASDEEIQSLNTKLSFIEKEEAKREKDLEKSDYEKRVKDYEYMIDRLTKEVSSLQGQLSSANQKNKELEETVKLSKQGSHSFLEREIVVERESQLESTSLDLSKQISNAKEQENETGKKSKRNSENGLVTRGETEGAMESERNIELKKDFEQLRLHTEELEAKLSRERENKRALEDKLENVEIDKRRSLKMYRDIEEECNRLKEELHSSEPAHDEVEVRMREKLRARLRSKEEEIEVLNKQVDSLKKDMQLIKEERAKGDTLYVNLAEKYKNLLKENKILEQEKYDRYQRKSKSEELEESLQTRLDEVAHMKDEIESMRDNLRALVEKKQTEKMEYASLQNDLVKVTNDRQILEKRVRDEMQRADKLGRERTSLQERVSEMQKDLHKRDLVTAADKQAISSYADELKILKDEKANADQEAERLRKQSNNLLHDLEKLNRERKDFSTLQTERENVLKELEILKNENQRLDNKLIEFKQVKSERDCLRDDLEKKDREMKSFTELQLEKDNAAKQAEILRDENEKLVEQIKEMDNIKEEHERLTQEKVIGLNMVRSLREEHEQNINDMCKEKDDLLKQNNALANENKKLLQQADEYMRIKEESDRLKKIDDKQSNSEKEHSADEIATFRNEKKQLLQKVEDFDQIKEELEKLRQEKVVGLEKMALLREDNDALLDEIKEAEEEVDILRNEKQKVITEAESLKETLLKKQEEIDKVNGVLGTLTAERDRTLKDNETLRRDNESVMNEIQKLKEKIEDFNALREEKMTEEVENVKEMNETLIKKQKEIDKVCSDFGALTAQRDRTLKDNETLRSRNESLMSEIQRLKLNLGDFNFLKDEKDTILQQLNTVNEDKKSLRQELEKVNRRNTDLEKENETFANDIQQFQRTHDHMRILEGENKQTLIQIDNLEKENKSLMLELEKFEETKETLRTSFEDRERLQKNIENLEVQLGNQALEGMRLKKETTSLKRKVETLSNDLHRLQNEKSLQQEQASAVKKADEEKIEELSSQLRKLQEEKACRLDEKSYENVENKSGHNKHEVKILKEEIGFLEKEVEDLSEELRELLQKYKTVQKEYECFKEECNTIKERLDIKISDLEKVSNERDALERRRGELEQELEASSNELQKLKPDYDSKKLRLENAEKEIQDLIKDNEELHQNYVDLEERYGRIRKLNRELEEDIDIESNNLADAKTQIDDLNRSNTNLRQRIAKMQQEIAKLRGISEPVSQNQENVDVARRGHNLEQNKTIVQSRREELEAKLIEEELKSSKFGEDNRQHWRRVESLDEGHRTKLYEHKKTIECLEREKKNFRSSKERVNALEKELQELKEKLEIETNNANSKIEEIKLKKKENDSLIYELETTRHRIVANVLNPLEEAQLPGNFQVSAADISAGKSKAWSCIKESITALIREIGTLTSANATLQEEHSRMKQTNQEPKKESVTLADETKKNTQNPNVADSPTLSRKTPSIQDIVGKQKELQALQSKIAQDQENLAVYQNKNKELLRRIEFMKRMQRTGNLDHERPPTQKAQSVDERPPPTDQAKDKLQRLHTIESISIVKSEDDIKEHRIDPNHAKLPGDLLDVSSERSGEIVPSHVGGLETSATQLNRNEDDKGSQEEQMLVARELVKKNRQIFELEQEVDTLLGKIEESSTDPSSHDKLSSEIENFRQEVIRLEVENKSLKELTNDAALAASKKKIESLEVMNNFLQSEKEEVILQISAKNKKIELLERRVHELTAMRTNAVNGSNNGICGDSDAHINELDEELRKCKHRVAELEAELEHLNNSHNSKLKRELDEIEAKWTKRLRQECMELQSELSEKHIKEKQLWQKKEVELQNIIRQMKIVMDKKLGQAESERKKLAQQLETLRSSAQHGSTLSLDSISDDSVESSSPQSGPSSSAKVPQTDCLSDRELRRVAYKLNGEEWSQLGSFLGVGDGDLLQLGGLTMGPQEKAFRLLCVWRTRCRLSRSQMVSQLAVSLEEVNRKDVAQFVLEQFMSGKPRKKLFGW